ncbi:MAG TPA: hypothetical protein DD979_05070 [Gammaproteobacteria bacterium]|nr:hypothetical protein [Gammaproteobacteria bacterium]
MALAKPNSWAMALYVKMLLWRAASAETTEEVVSRLRRVRRPHVIITRWLIPLLLSQQRHEAALLFCTQAPNVLKYFFKCNPAVLRFCYAEGLPVHRQAYARQSVEQLFAKTRPLSEYLVANQHCAMSVVGNAPVSQVSEHARSRGSLIDAHPLVVRFNRCDTQSADIAGGKTSLWAANPALADFSALLPHGADVLLSGVNLYYKPGSLLQRLGKLPASQVSIYTADAIDWADLVALLQAPPSAGLLMAYCAQKHHGHGDNRFFGFSGGLSRQNHSNDDAVFSGRHNWAAERAPYQQLMPNSMP